jgi:hypothetical protein
MKDNLPSNLFSAVIFSLPNLAEAVIEKKLLELKKRIAYASIGKTILTTFTRPFMDNPINMVLYVTPFVINYTLC